MFTQPITLHPHQASIVAHSARFTVLACGRRFGKTTIAIHMLQAHLKQGHAVAYFAPTYRMVSEVWRTLKRLNKPQTGTLNAHEHRLELYNGGSVECWSLKAADTARGRSYDFIVVDEAAQFADLDEVWNAVLRPLLTDRQGGALFASTPRGRNYFFQLYQQGQDDNHPDWASFHAPTSANPFIPPEEIASAQSTMPHRLFLQEYLAEFLADSSSVFRGVLSVATLPRTAPADYPHGTRFVAGVDWGRTDDFTVISIFNAETCHEVALDRFNAVGWEVQRGRIKQLCDAWAVAHILAEANSIGEPNIQALQAEDLPIAPFMTTSKSKAPLIERLALAIERGQVALLDDPVATGELLAYQTERLRSGTWRYGAPRGGHDDTVIARALAWEAVNAPPLNITWQADNPFSRRRG